MTLKPSLNLAPLLLLVTACAARQPAPEPPQSTFDPCKQYLAKDVSEVISAWGPPSLTYAEPNGDVLYEWDRINNVATNDRDAFTRAKERGTPPNCLIRFTVGAAGNHTIGQCSWEGNGCN